MPHQTAPRTGFTPLELLVVVAIITLLVTLPLPAAIATRSALAANLIVGT